jgi:hypothetical protein
MHHDQIYENVIDLNYLRRSGGFGWARVGVAA